MKIAHLPGTIALILAGLIGSASGLTINPATFDFANSPSRPVADGIGDKLVALANAAGNYWESVLGDAHTMTTVTLRYDINAFPGGTVVILGTSGGKTTNVRISIRPDVMWYYDSTPVSHSEFALASTLERDLGATDYPFLGSPPAVLEVAYSGAGSGAAASKNDLYTVLLRCFGQALGFTDSLSAMNTEAADGDVDFLSSQTGSAVCAVIVNDTDDPFDYSLAIPNALMNYSTTYTAGRRTLPSATDVLAVARAGGWSQVNLPRQDFAKTGTHDFDTIAGWMGGSTPTTSTDIFVRQDTATTVTANSNRAVGNIYVGGNSKIAVNAGILAATSETNIRYEGGVFSFPEIEVAVPATDHEGAEA